MGKGGCGRFSSRLVDRRHVPYAWPVQCGMHSNRSPSILEQLDTVSSNVKALHRLSSEHLEDVKMAGKRPNAGLKNGIKLLLGPPILGVLSPKENVFEMIWKG